MPTFGGTYAVFDYTLMSRDDEAACVTITVNLQNARKLPAKAVQEQLEHAMIILEGLQADVAETHEWIKALNECEEDGAIVEQFDWVAGEYKHIEVTEEGTDA